MEVLKVLGIREIRGEIDPPSKTRKPVLQPTIPQMHVYRRHSRRAGMQNDGNAAGPKLPRFDVHLLGNLCRHLAVHAGGVDSSLLKHLAVLHNARLPSPAFLPAPEVLT